MRTCGVNPGKRRESRLGKWSKLQFSDVLGARPPSGSRLRPVGQDGADHPDHETDAHDDPDLAGGELPGERGTGLIRPGPEHLREDAGDLDREADQSHNLTARTSHLPTLENDCNPPNDQGYRDQSADCTHPTKGLRCWAVRIPCAVRERAGHWLRGRS